MNHRLPHGKITAVLIVLSLLAGCISPTRNQPALPDPGSPDIWSVAGLPAFPGDIDPGSYSAVHRTSESETLIPGINELTEEGQNNYEDPGIEALVIAPGAEDDLAFAVYDLAGLGDDRPIQFDIEVDAAPLLPGGDDPLPLSYWVGLSNYTKQSWEWYGPFDQSQSLVMNSPTVLERYLGNSGIMYYCLATLSGDTWITPANPDGLTACQINLGTVTTEDAASPDYNETKPLFVPIETHTPASLGPPKDGSVLDPAQYVTINWTHRADPQSPDSGATTYQVYRDGPEDVGPVFIGGVDAPMSTYVDPTDNAPGVPELVPGWTYSYSLRAWNDQGHTSFDSFEATIPELANNWGHTWGRDNEDQANAVLVDNDGDFYIAGFTRDLATGTGDLLLLGYSADGTKKTSVVWGNPNQHDEGWGICSDLAGNKYISGLTRSFVPGEQQLALVKFNENDILVWDRSWDVDSGNGVNSSIGQAVACNPAGTEIYVTGSISEAQDSVVLLRFDQSGQIVTTPEDWSGRWWDGAGNNTYGRGIAVKDTGDIYIVGEYITGIGNSDALIMHVNPDNTLGWARTWGTPAGDEGLAIAVDQANGSIYITGWHNNSQVMVVKLHANGTVDWQKSWVPAGGTGQGNGIVLAGNSVFVTGDVGIAGEFSLFVLELHQGDGKLLSQRIWGSTAEVEAGRAIAATPDGAALLVAGVALASDGGWDIPDAQLTNAEAPDTVVVGMIYDPGFNQVNESLLGVGPVFDGVEDTGGGAPDALVLRLQP